MHVITELTGPHGLAQFDQRTRTKTVTVLMEALTPGQVQEHVAALRATIATAAATIRTGGASADDATEVEADADGDLTRFAHARRARLWARALCEMVPTRAPLSLASAQVQLGAGAVQAQDRRHSACARVAGIAFAQPTSAT